MPSFRRSLPVFAAFIALGFTLVACADDTADTTTSDAVSGPASGTVSFGAEQGVDMTTALRVDDANYVNTDMWATNAGGHLKLQPGGDSPTRYRSVNWFFKDSAGVYEKFPSLADVRETRPSVENGTALTKPQQGNGFVLKTRSGKWDKGWLQAVSDTSITIAFEAIPDA